MPDEPQSTKSLTPQRKHRKLLKDGSGCAVWPESIEAVFVEGLRKYADSPWSSYEGRGTRSRWRNQFLVDYLANAGIQRSKKQVASHVQVLRNMWAKGSPEYQLVAGGDELQDSIKVEEPLLTAEEDDASLPSNSPREFVNDFPPSPGETSPMFPGLSYSPSSPLSSIHDIDSPPRTLVNLASPYPYAVNSKAIPAAYSAAQAPVRYLNRITTLSLLADGMTPFTVSLDKLSPPSALPARTPPLALRLRLAMPLVDDPHAPPTLHGFFGSLRLATIWSAHAKVFTRVYDPAGRCVANDVAALHPRTIDLGTVMVDLPESALTRARWCDPATQSTITQQFVVDNATMLFVVYELDRRTALPSVEFLSFQKYVETSDARAPAGAYVAHTYGHAHVQSYPSPPAQSAASPHDGYYHSSSRLFAPSPSQMYPQHGLQHSPSSTSSLSAALTPVS